MVCGDVVMQCVVTWSLVTWCVVMWCVVYFLVDRTEPGTYTVSIYILLHVINHINTADTISLSQLNKTLKNVKRHFIKYWILWAPENPTGRLKKVLCLIPQPQSNPQICFYMQYKSVYVNKRYLIPDGKKIRLKIFFRYDFTASGIKYILFIYTALFSI